MIYTTLFLIGLLGLLAQSLLGISHGAHAGHAHTGGGHSHAGHGHMHHAGNAQGRGARAWGAVANLFSPLTLFSLCVGIGATGLLMRPLHHAPALVAAVAVLGGLVFYGLIVRPLWGLIFQFASQPSQALEGMVARTAEVLTRFDAGGKGLVRLTIDGQLVRVLATLEPDDRPAAGTILPGDKLIVTGVDGRTNTCRVTRLES